MTRFEYIRTTTDLAVKLAKALIARQKGGGLLTLQKEMKEVAHAYPPYWIDPETDKFGPVYKEAVEYYRQNTSRIIADAENLEDFQLSTASSGSIGLQFIDDSIWYDVLKHL